MNTKNDMDPIIKGILSGAALVASILITALAIVGIKSNLTERSYKCRSLGVGYKTVLTLDKKFVMGDTVLVNGVLYQIEK